MTTADRLHHLQRLLQQGVEDSIYTCAALAVGDSRRLHYLLSVGALNPPHPAEATPSSLFDLASLTKPVACASSVLALVEEGHLQLDEPLASFFDNAPPWSQRIRLRHLLTHTAGLPAWKPFYEHARAQALVEAVLHTPPNRLPNVAYEYSDLGYILLGEVVKQVTGRSLADYARERIFLPAGMNHTLYNPPETLLPHVAATANCPWRCGQVLRAQVHDANAWAMGGMSGHAGLFSTAIDLAQFCQLLLRGGGEVFSPLTVEQMFQNQIGSLGGQSFGWFTHPNEMLPRANLLPTSCIGHSGFTGTVLLLHRQPEFFIVLLTNRVYCAYSGERWLPFRRRLLNAVSATLR